MTERLISLILICAFVASCSLINKPETELPMEFLVDENYLAVYAMKSKAKYAKEFRDRAFKVNPKKFREVVQLKLDADEFNTESFDEGYGDYIARIKKDSFYENLLRETLIHRSVIENDWNKNASSIKFMKDLTGLSYRYNEPVKVYILHEEIGDRGNLWAKKKRIILFGLRAKFKNSFTVFLWHELLHFELPDSRKAHAVIELAADNELRSHLGKWTYPPFTKEGYQELKPTMQALLPQWRKYLERPSNLRDYFHL